MTEGCEFPEELRAEYDAAVLDASQRRKRAERLHTSLREAGLWQAGARILDVGSGSGLLLASLGDDARLRVGCDVRRELYLRARAQAGGIHFVQSHATVLPFPDRSFDLVTCLAVIEELADWQGALAEMARCVAPGGVLYVTVVNGRFLLPVYAMVDKLGVRVMPNWWEYARSSLRLARYKPAEGLGVPGLAGWRYVHVTPYLVRSQWPFLRLMPRGLLDWLMRRVAPSFGYAWQRPASGTESR